MADSDVSPSGDPDDPAFREVVVQRMLREGLSAKAAARAYGLESRQVAGWKKRYLQDLKRAGKGGVQGGASRRSGGRGEVSPVVEDISRKRVRVEDVRRPQPPVFGEGKAAAGDVDERRKAAGAPAGGEPAAGASITQALHRPLPHEGAEISGEAQERFSKNWARMDGGGTPLPPPPGAPVPLQRRERLATRLQELPGTRWLLHGGRFGGGPWMLLLFVILVGGVAFMVLKDAAEYASPSFPTIPGETLRYFEPLTQDEIGAAEEVITQFFNVESLEDFRSLIRAPETVMPILFRHYADHPYTPTEVQGFTYHRRADLDGMDITLYGVKLGPLAKVQEVPVENTPEGLKVDWEVATNYQSMPWRDFRLTRPEGTSYFRLSLQPSTYYNKPFHDPAIFRSFRMTYPGELHMLNGYAMIDTAVEQRLRELLPDYEDLEEVVVGLTFPQGDFREDELVEITHLRSSSWIVDYAPGERHFDLPELGAPTDAGSGLTGENLPGSDLQLEEEAAPAVQEDAGVGDLPGEAEVEPAPQEAAESPEQ